ncbi:glycerol-3-phosphate acyltransferase [Paenibacillus harenae]|uniref:glycerol-3-phosphate acyltransferase n=1 Tax=Paenibacillus harenae TaxID=306543 RepID=UPI00278F5F92|nr:glycerol-3-phosphate acyltransferase [Paenibacillus harenae]MDQ0062196.1 acyl-phosphate glycerol 3-phosphate acyltransferase [Paenibacillus harenae]
MTIIIGWTLLSFISGSLMFSYWLGLVAKRNLKAHGDGNPGALNLWRTAGYGYGLAGIALDFAKGYAPLLWIVHANAVSGYWIVLPSTAALLGHVFSPFMRGRGGKAIAATFGVWSALTGFSASLAYAIILALLLVITRWQRKGKPLTAEADALQVVLGMLLLGVYVYVSGFYDGEMLLFWLINLVLLGYTHRNELRRLLSSNRTDCQ